MATVADLDEDALRVAQGYTGGFERHKKMREVFLEYGGGEWALSEFLTEITQAADQIPANLRDVAKVELGGDYDESICLQITYPDVESDEELGVRIQRAVDYAIEQRERDRAKFERLKAKFG